MCWCVDGSETSAFRGINVMELRARGALAMKPIARIGMDTSKNVFQLHGVDDAEEPTLRRQLRRREMIRIRGYSST